MPGWNLLGVARVLALMEVEGQMQNWSGQARLGRPSLVQAEEPRLAGSQDFVPAL